MLHTKTPWVLNSDGRVEDARGASIAQCFQHSLYRGRPLECNHAANAARIVECVNACEGIENPAGIEYMTLALKATEGLLTREKPFGAAELTILLSTVQAALKKAGA